MSKKGFTYTLQIDAEINDLITKTNQVKKSMQSIMDAGKAPGAEKIFTSIEKAIERLQNKASQPIESVAAFQNLQKDAAAVGASLGKLGTIIENLGNMGTADKLDLLPPNLKKQIEDASSALAAFSKATAQAEQKTQELADAENQLAAAQKELKKVEGRARDKKALVTAQQQLVDAAHAEADAIKAKIEALKKYQATAAAYEAAGGNKSAKGDSKANAGKGLEGLNLPGDRKAAVAAVPGLNPSDAQAVADAIARLNDEYHQASKAVTDTEAIQRRYNSQLNDANTVAGVASEKVAALNSTVARLNAEFEKDKAKNVQAAYAQLRNEAGKLGVDLKNIPLEYTEQNLEQLNEALLRIKQEGIEQVTANLQSFETQTGEAAQALGGLQNQLSVSQEKFVQMDNTVRNTQAFAQRISQFVGLEGAAQLARRALRDVMATVKDLDEAMTEMAVVTDLDVGDYWDQLPEYTTRANELGVSIKSAYEAATLFYQQGLKTNEVVEISNETLKMARIAGLSAENATNKMTAALRGFNMELNETSAQKVSDVYSQLAAITASDVKEISSAMTKTASIASSAGMEFETTAAFLSQIIETTRESAETAGTAMKTVIARFQELKKDPSEIGEVDGEIVDANKIETALRTVGVSLRDSQGQFRDLDEVFLELASKWDDLDTNTQRYIATIAAGSRQQSRFIAMMSDYGRTQELVSAANNSAGASNKQFEKTLDSLESKINQLNNAWDTFTMGLMSDELVKFGVDLLTKIITLLDKATGAFEGLGGAIGKVGLTLTIFKIGKILLDKFVITIQERFREAGFKAIEGFEQGAREALNQTEQTDTKKDFSVIGKTDKNEKPQMFRKTREVMHSGLSNLGAASQSLTESQNYFKQADAHEASAQKLNTQGSTKVDTGIAKIGAEFKAKMTQMTGDTKKADEAWKKYVEDLKKGGKQGYVAIQAMNRELEETANLNDDLDAADPEGLGIPTSDEMKRLEGWTEGFQEITQGNKDLADAAENTAEAELEREEATRLAAQADKQSQEGMAQLGTAMSTVGQTAIGIGVGLTALGGALESMGLEGAAEGFSKVSTVLSIFGTVLMALPPIIKLLGLTFSSTGVQISIAGFTAQLGWWPFVLILLAVVAAVGLLVAGFVLLSKNTPEAKLRAVEEAAQAAADAAKESKEAFEELQNTFDNYKDMRDSLDELEEGTLEWKNAMLELNSVVLELLTLYPQLAQYVKMGDNGVLTISDEGMTNILDVASYGAQNMATVAAMAQMAVIDQKQTMLKDSSSFESERKWARGGGYAYSGQTDTARLNELDKKLQEGTFDFSSQKITKEDLGGLSDDQLKQLYNQQNNYHGYAETLSWPRENFEKSLASSIDHYGEMTLYSKDLYDYTEGYTYGMSQMVAYQKEYNDELKQNIQYDLQRQALMQSAITSQLDANVQAAGYGKAIVESLSQVESLDLNQMKKDIATDNQGNKSDDRNLWGNGNNSTNDALKEALGERGLSATGDEKKDLQAYYKSLSGIEYDYSEDGKAADNIMAGKIAEAEAAEKLGSYVNEMYETAEASKYLDEVLSNDLDVDVDSAKEEINSLKVATEESAEGISEVAKNALTKALDNIEKERGKIDARLGEVFSEGFKFNTDGAYKMAQEFFSVYDMMSGYAGEATAILFADVIESMNEVLASGELSESDFQDKMNSFLDVSWDSAIDGAAALKEMLEGDDAGLKDFATKLLLIEDRAYSATAQMNEFYNSLSSDALKELAADGEITATEILELAKSNEKLATMMDTTGVSAATLGNYYELLESGVMSAYEATNEFIIALDKLNAASNAIENAFGFIDTFEPSRSQTEISNYFAEMRESAMSLYDIGAYGDQQLKDYINAFLGDSNWQAIIDKNNGDMKAAIDEAMAQINSYGENLYGTWQTLVEQGLQGVSMGEDGSIQFDMTQIGDLEQLKQQIIDMGWSETMADALLADAQTFSVELSNGLDQLGISAAFESWLSGALSINGKTIIPKSQVEAMAKELGTTVEKLTEDLKAEGIEVSELITSDGLLSKDMREQLIADAEAAGKFDLDTNYQLLLELGLEDDEAKAELKTMANSLANMPMKINGKTITQTAGVLYDSTGVAIEGGTTGGLIDGLEDPKVKAAQELSALEQGKIMAEAQAKGSIAATQAAVMVSAKAADAVWAPIVDIWNTMAGALNWPKIKKNATKVDTKTQALLAEAQNTIDAQFSPQIADAAKRATAKTTSVGNVNNAVTNLTDKYTKDTASIISSYNNKNAQEVGVVQEDKPWENPYDELYNLNQKLNTVIRTREKLERAYEKAVEDSSKTAQDLANITATELNQLKEEADIQKDIATEAASNAEKKQTENSKYSGLYSFDATTGEVQVDWEKVNSKGWNEEEGAAFEDFISYLEEQGDIIKEAQDALEDVEDSVEEIEKRGRDATSDIYNQVKEGLVKQYESELDALETLNNSIQEASEAMLSKMQEQIDEVRQARDNEKAENEIANKEVRLAYLMRDSSGGNAVEIAELQKEIEEDKQSYTDSLVDQAIDKLSRENEKAAEQREKQLDLQRAQLDAYVNSKTIWDDIKQLVNKGFVAVANGKAFKDTTAGQLAASGADVDTLNPFEKDDFYTELEKSAKEGAIHEGFVGIQGGGPVTSISSLADSIKDTVDGLQMKVTTTSTGAEITTIVPAYKEGGLADFTGPAWLDGTKSKPEIILNQTDSANFMQLRDILADILQGTTNLSGTTEKSKGGDNYYDIEINVESISDDYDVEQLADKIRDMIYEDSIYRNVNSINGTR